MRKNAPTELTWRGRLFGCLFFSIFFFAGAFFMGIVVLRPLYCIVVSSRWTQIPCTIEHSNVRVHSGSKSSTYSVDIGYNYEVAGQAYHGTRYNFSFGSSSGRTGKEEIVNRYPPGMQTVCYVNPAKPSEAVISRAIPGDIWFGFIPLVFIIVGGAGMCGMFMKSRPGRVGAPARDELGRRKGKQAAPILERTPRGTLRLKPKAGPLAKVFGMLLIAIFWNGIVSVFLYHVIDSWKHGNFAVFLALFLIPFVLIGIALILGVVYCFLALFNPEIVLEVETMDLPIGGSTPLAWKINGDAMRIRKLTLELVGRESATYRRGTTTSTDTSTFARIPIFETEDRREMAAGERKLPIPNPTMHSLETPNNKIEWFLRAHGSIQGWPDVSDEYSLTVTPLEI